MVTESAHACSARVAEGAHVCIDGRANTGLRTFSTMASASSLLKKKNPSCVLFCACMMHASQHETDDLQTAPACSHAEALPHLPCHQHKLVLGVGHCVHRDGCKPRLHLVLGHGKLMQGLSTVLLLLAESRERDGLQRRAVGGEYVSRALSTVVGTPTPESCMVIRPTAVMGCHALPELLSPKLIPRRGPSLSQLASWRDACCFAGSMCWLTTSCQQRGICWMLC
jgi:hypothetical protein